MSSLGEYRPPNQLQKDEDKYWKFTKTQIGYMLVGFFIGFFVFRILMFIHLGIVGGVLWVMLVLVGALCGGLTIPNKKYLSGGGLRVDQYLFRLLKHHRKKNKVIYTNNINRDRTLEEELQLRRAAEQGTVASRFMSLFDGGREE